MPKVKPLIKKDPREVNVLSEIGATLATLGVSRKELAQRCGMKPSTLNLRMHDIASMRLGELWAIQDLREKMGVKINDDSHGKFGS